MKKMLCVLLAILLMTAAPCYSTAEGWGEECSPTLEDQLFEMNEWMYSAREALLAEDYDLAAFYLQSIAIYDTELFPDEVTWALATLGDLCAAGLYCDENSDETGETPTERPRSRPSHIMNRQWLCMIKTKRCPGVMIPAIWISERGWP